MNPKKLFWYFLIFLLTLGACLTLGFLSFGGMYAFAPIIGLAISAFVLSVVYEAEIYFQNILGALKKLLQFDYYEKLIANEILRLYLVDILKYRKEKPPQFFIDYEKQLHLAHKSKDALEKKKLKAMEAWFALQLFSNEEPTSAYQKELRDYLKKDPFIGDPQAALSRRKWLFRGVALFSMVSGIFMGLGTTYLVMESLALFHIAFVTLSIPGAVVPLFGLIFLASVAYSLLTYHAITDMINNETLKSWVLSLRDNFRKGVTFRNICLALLSATLVILAVALTVCTAGTWWTIAKEAQPFFSFMAGKAKDIITIIMGFINPIFMFGSTLAFNLENIKQTYDIIDESTQLKEGETWSGKIKACWNSLSDALDKRQQQENIVQKFNPFFWILRYTILPLRFIFFAGHIASIGVTADKMPGIPKELSGLLGVLSEGFEDVHYFFGHDHHELIHADTQQLLDARFSGEASHSHDADIPTRLLKLAFAPLYLLTILWDWGFGKLNGLTIHGHSIPGMKHLKPLSFSQAFVKHTGWSNTSIPTRCVKILCSPFYFIHSLWDFHFNNPDEKQSIADIFEKHLDWGVSKDKHKKHGCHHHHDHPHKKKETEPFILKTQDRPSKTFEISHLIYKIEKHQQLHFIDAEDEHDMLAKKKASLLGELASALKKIREQKEPSLNEAHALIKTAKSNTIFAEQRCSFFAPAETKTVKLLNQLEKQTAIAAA